MKTPGEYLPRTAEQESAAATNPWRTLLQDAADIMTEEMEPVVEIVEGIVAEHSKLVIVSGAKCFKTWLTIHMALAIQAGSSFLGRRTGRKRVLYVNLELKPGTFKRRLQAIAKKMGITVESEWFQHLPLRGHMAGIGAAELVLRIIEIARELKIEVVVIDPLFKANTEGEENSSRDQTIFFNELDRITTEAACTLILNDHSGKGNQSEKDPLDVIRGSSAKGGDLDAAMVLRRHEVDGCFRIDLVHRELPPVAPFVLAWKYPLMELRADLDPAAMRKAKGGRTKGRDPVRLLAAIAQTTAENPISISAWAEYEPQKTNLSRSTQVAHLRDYRHRRVYRSRRDEEMSSNKKERVSRRMLKSAVKIQLVRMCKK